MANQENQPPTPEPAQQPNEPTERAGLDYDDGDSRLDNIRGWLNRNTLTVTLLSNVVLLCALTTIVLQVKPKAAPPWPMAYYYDISSDSVFVARTTDFPPIYTPASKGHGKREGVRAYVFSCGDCSKNDGGRFIGFLEAFTDEAKEKLENAGGYRSGSSQGAPGPMMPDVMFMMSNDGHLVASPAKPSHWVGANSEEGRQIVSEATRRCGATVAARSCPADEDPLWRPTQAAVGHVDQATPVATPLATPAAPLPTALPSQAPAVKK